MYTTSKAKHVKGVSLSIGGYLDWMKRSASFIYPVTTMVSRSFVNGDKNFEMATKNIFRSPFSDLKVDVTWSTVR
jgi:hypothetical protein